MAPHCFESLRYFRIALGGRDKGFENPSATPCKQLDEIPQLQPDILSKIPSFRKRQLLRNRLAQRFNESRSLVRPPAIDSRLARAGAFGNRIRRNIRER